jgi:signal transduction histidine kinase/DNA-binding response OmpR family regulator
MLLILVLPFWVSQNVFCQNPGFKYIKNYTFEEYGGYPQNWCALQDKRGIIYVGNQAGLLEFDGVSWRKIEVPNKSVRSLAMDETGTIYVGGKNELGFLVPDEKGALQYQSLRDYIDKDKRNFSRVWGTHTAKERVYFSTFKFLFRWDTNSKQIKIWKADYRFLLCFMVEGKFYIDQDNVGLMQMIDDSLELVPGGEAFALKIIYMIVPYDTQKMLIGTRSNGFYLYDGKTVRPFPTGVDDYLKPDRFYRGIRLSSGDFALAALGTGLIIIDSRGRQKHIFNKDYGLQDDKVNYVFEDIHRNLWLGLNSGISKIEYASPFCIYDERSNLPPMVTSVIKHNNHMYAGTAKGLYYLASSNKFRPVPGIANIFLSLVSIDDSLFGASSDGVFQIKKNIKRRVLETQSFVLLRSNIDKNRIWVGTNNGLVSLHPKNERENLQWEVEYKFENTTQAIGTIVEDEKGNLWLGTKKGALKLDFSSAGKITNPVLTRYNPSHQLPANDVDIYMAAGQVMFHTRKGVFRFNEKTRTFVPDHTLKEEPPDGLVNIFRLAQGKNKDTCFTSMGRVVQAIPGVSRTCILNQKTSFRLPRIVFNIYTDKDAVWVATEMGLVRYDTTIKKNYNHYFPPLIRKALANETLIFNGYKTDNGPGANRLFPHLAYKYRNLHFEFAAPFYEDEIATKYQYLLEGYDHKWSDWTRETKKDYTNLYPGLYSFRVRAKNVYGCLSGDAVFQFKILPPWYKTWWAFLLYAAVLFMLIYLIVKWQRSIQLEKEKQKLEQTVKDRTKELKEQAEKLKEMDKVKSRFFANISHEFRTPLTLIMGPLEQMLAKSHNQEQKKKLKLMLRNSQRLLNLINQLLELSKFDNGKVKLQACRQNIIPFLKGITASFEPVINNNQLDLIFHAEEDNITLYFDPEKLEKVILNILSNAVKFTPPGGKIIFAISISPSEQESFPPGSVNISVSDNGPGILRDQLSHIFNRFYQSDNTYEHNHKGTGIGLAIAKEIVELHHGRIDVHSHEGEGTEFIIRLPAGDAHLEPDEIVAPLEKEYEHKNPGEIPALYVHGDEKEEEKIEYEPAIEKDVENIILVVEDSKEVRKYIKDSLEPVYKVVEAANGQEGLQKAQKIIPDLIICDIMMPELDGYELCRQIKENITTSHIPVILLTAKASEESIIRGLETGADDYITKPFNTNILSARIKNLIDLRRLFQMTLNREMTLHPEKMSVSKTDKEFIRELQEVMEKNLSEPEFNVEELKKKLCMSGTSLYRKIQALSGLSPTDFIRTYRLKRAAQLLENGFGSITEVAFEVGFSSRAYFTKCFKEKFHQLPSTYQTSEAN